MRFPLFRSAVASETLVPGGFASRPGQVQLQDRPAIAGLLAAGADVGAQTAEGETALHIVCRQGAPRVLARCLAVCLSAAIVCSSDRATRVAPSARHVSVMVQGAMTR